MMSKEKPSKTSRRNFLKTSLLTAAAAGLTNLTTGAQEPDRDAIPKRKNNASLTQPNILILMVDEMRYPTVYESFRLQNFRRQFLVTQQLLRSTGMEFHRHYTASTACAPSRTSFYTGQYPSLHGVTNTDGAAKSADDDGCRSLRELESDLGAFTPVSRPGLYAVIRYADCLRV